MYNGFICKTSFVEVVKCIFADGGVKAFIIESCSGTVGFIDSVSYFGKKQKISDVVYSPTYLDDDNNWVKSSSILNIKSNGGLTTRKTRTY